MPFTITQNLFLGSPKTITVVKCDDYNAIEERHFQQLLDASCRILGVAATFDENCKISSIAFSTLSQVLVVNTSPSQCAQPQAGRRTKRREAVRRRNLIQDHLLLNPEFHKYAFRMDQIATSLYFDLSVRISDAVDMLSVSTNGRHSLQALMDAMGGETGLRKQNVKALFFKESVTFDAASQVALKAWAACWAANLAHMASRFESLPRINTMSFPAPHITAIASISRHADRLEVLKPTAVRNDVITDQSTTKKGGISVRCDRFSTRIRNSGDQVLQIEIEDEGVTSHVTGRTRKVNGRDADITVNAALTGSKVLSVTTVGKEDPTVAQHNREAIILATLQHASSILDNPFFQALWLPEERPIWPEYPKQKSPLPILFERPLNSSQCLAVQKILSDKDEDRVVVIQGPPGTGKTTVIVASVMSYCNAESGRNIWVAAQSNVAVKNIAEKFIKEGFHKFKLLVSKEFHFDWHEDLYEQLEPCLIRSDEFKMSVVEASRIILDCKVIMCTLSMFSHPHIGVFRRIVPVEMIILDEASQMECGDYLPILNGFRSTLSKLVFIGDDEQLPPYGQEEIPELRSIFEFPHLRRKALFLDTQYRMPHVIGNFISRNVYDGKLVTNHSCRISKVCLFVDVNSGQEVQRGRSWINIQEAQIVVKLARSYVLKNRAFRIITPYDAQRSLIEDHMKSAKLPWEDKVFNVDSFQGNEDDHIIVSVVRSDRPGFLGNQRRTNVMLTRCKKSTVICSSRNFLFHRASGTLVGKLAASLGTANWVNEKDVVRFCSM